MSCSLVLQKMLAVVLLILFASECAHTTTTTKATIPTETTASAPPTASSDSNGIDNEAQTTSAASAATTSASMTTSTAVITTIARDPNSENCKEPIEEKLRNFELHTPDILEKYEGNIQLITCKMLRTEIESCNQLLMGLKESTKIYTHHRNNAGNLSDHEIIEDATRTELTKIDDTSLFEVEFKFRVLHRDHLGSSIYCRASTGDSGSEGNVISRKETFNSIDKMYNVSITPNQVAVPLNTAFNLTCSVKAQVARDFIVWKSKKYSGDHNWVRVGHDHYQMINDSSILTVKKNKEWNGTYMCTTEVNQNPNHLHAETMVLVKDPDKSVIHATTIALVVTALLIVVIVIALLIRRRALKKRIEISLMLMELQEAGANAQTATRSGSVHSLTNLDPAVNCYASSINPDGSLAAETLAATFSRFTTMYAPWQKDRSKLVIKHILGEGNFGSVCLGIMPDVFFQGVSSQVAVKTIKPARMDRKAITEFEKEVSIMTTLKHDSIVSLVGLCTETMPLYIIMEYMENGQLNDFLMGKAPNKLEDTSLSIRDLIYMSLQPCQALEYLANKNVVHRDISARNCLVGDKLTVKLADFGLSRGTAVDDGKNYYKKDGGMVPVKWMAPEALNFGKYTSANDVWSFGVLMWEIFSFGAIPYLSHSNQQVIVFVNRGGRLEKPDYCPESVWGHICSCWTKAPEDRITIGGLVNMLITELDIIDTSANNGELSHSLNAV